MEKYVASEAGGEFIMNLAQAKLAYTLSFRNQFIRNLELGFL